MPAGSFELPVSPISGADTCPSSARTQLSISQHNIILALVHSMDDLLGVQFDSSTPSSQSKPAGYGGRTAFDYLAASSQPQSRATSPLVQSAAASRQSSSQSQPRPAVASTGGDAFGDLFGPAAGTTKPGPSLSMAEKLAQDSAQRLGGQGWGALDPKRTGMGSSEGRM